MCRWLYLANSIKYTIQPETWLYGANLKGYEMKYKVCEHCGSFLDFGEKCDCQEEENKKILKIEKYVRENYKQQKDGQMEMIL